MRRRTTNCVLVLFALVLLTSVGPHSRGLAASRAPISALWEAPTDLSTRDLFNGQWGAKRAPDPHATYTYLRPKTGGVNRGVIVRDPQGRVWHVKQQTDSSRGSEGPVEVALSRVLSAVGYHQPPVYFVPSFRMIDDTGTHVVPGGRFRLRDDALKDLGTWSWQRNPFVDTYPYQGLLVMLMMFDSSDLKNDNNSLYEIASPGSGPDRWYVVRDLGTALGETGKLAPKRGDPELFERQPFITGVENGFVRFSYHGWHQELFDRRIAPRDLQWATEWLGRLTDSQWADAFRAGGYPPEIANRFIARLQQKIADARRLGGAGAVVASPSR